MRTAIGSRGEVDPGRGLDDLDREVDDREDLPPARDRGLRVAVDLREVGEHVQEHVRQEQERGDASERESPIRSERRSEQHDHRHGDRVEERGDREQRRRTPVRDDGRPVPFVDRALQAPVGPILQAVGADHGRAHDALRDLGHQLPDARPHQVERLRQLALQRRHQPEQGDDQQHDRDRQLPRVDEHERQRSEHERDRDDPRDPAPLRELRQGVDVGGHPGDEHTALLLGLLRDRQLVDVLERAHAQHHQRLLGRVDEPARRLPARDVRQHHQRERRSAEREDVPGAEAAFEAVVEDLLDEHRRDERRRRHAQRDDDREPQALPQLRRLVQPAPKHRPRALQVRGDLEVLVRRGDLLRGHAHVVLRS